MDKAANGTHELREIVPPTCSLTVAKDVTLNGELKYDDVANGQRFYVGLKEWNGSTSSWENVTQTIKVRNGASDITIGAPWVEAIMVGTGCTGSTGTAVFEDLPMGTYRTYELADGAMVGHTDYRLAEDLFMGPPRSRRAARTACTTRKALTRTRFTRRTRTWILCRLVPLTR